MPATPKTHRIRLAAIPLLMLAVLGVVLGRLAYGRAMHRIDRRLTHSALFAARPRPQGMHPSHSHTHWLAVQSTAPHRRLPAYDALPPELIAAVVATEDRRFFQHGGVNYLRTAQCAVEDTLTRHITCGGSTITQQLARAYFLSQHQTIRRKLEEILIARRLEQRLTKQQIFVMYTRIVSFGENDGQEITGFEQAAQVFFHRPLRQLDLAQDALLAGMVHAPNFDNPVRHPERALHRRNVVLDSMVATGAITQAEAEAAEAEPLALAGITLPSRSSLLDDGDAQGS